MARKPRLDFPGAWHHVMHRGARRAPIFRDDGDCVRFLGILEDCLHRFGIEVHAYALMPNHYHLLLRSVRGNLSRAMRHLNGVYTQASNRARRWDGPLFRGRFHSQSLVSEAQLPYVLAYIHLNPLRANLVTRLTSDCWTSHLAYTGRQSAPEWLSRGFFLSLFGDSERLHEYVLDLHRGRLSWPERMALDTGFLPTLETALSERRAGDSARRLKTGNEVLEAVRRATGASLAEIRTARMGPRANPARRFAAWALAHRTDLTRREIGRLLNMTTRQVHNVVNRWSEKDARLTRWRAELDVEEVSE
ncbi:MAG: transposase [Proteobacteria bacterium]|jgi:REP element-mobilizing transposase RayT|nr:transposase [Pseudomonadota bacterium]